jgi:hypothetical protein
MFQGIVIVFARESQFAALGNNQDITHVSPFSPIVTCNLNVFGVHDRCVMPLNLQYMFNRPKGASLELTLLDGRNLAKAGIRVSG